jgi:hypothetical protein
LSISDGRSPAPAEPAATDFDHWLRKTYAATKGFTALIVLIRIGRKRVRPLSSAFVHVIGDEIAWGEVTTLLSGSGVTWDAVVFFPVAAKDGGPVDEATARLRLRMVETRIEDEPLAINEGQFFDVWGRRMRIDEVPS